MRSVQVGSLRRRWGVALTVATLVSATVLAAGASAQASPPINNGQPITGKPMAYHVQDPSYYWMTGSDGVNCSSQAMKFEPTHYTVDGAPAVSTINYGVQNGAGYQIEVPAHWNGDLVLWAHGFNGNGNLLCVQKPNIDRAWYLAHGYAWAASSYTDNGYDVVAGVKDTHALIPLVTHTVAKPSHVYLTGESMGGHIVGVSLEQYPNSYDAAMPVCGVLGDQQLFDYYYGASAVAAALAGSGQALPFPTTNSGYTDFVRSTSNMTIHGSTIATSVPGLTPSTAYGAWATAVGNLTGGAARPGAVIAAYAYWNQFGFGPAPINTLPFLLGVYPGTTSGTIGVAHGNVVDNTGTVYNTGDPSLNSYVNSTVKRISADPSGSNNGLNGIPVIQGDPSVPVLTLHGTGDLFVPLSMEQIYAQRVAAHNQSNLLVQRAIRNVGHCGFTQTELQAGFTSLVSWAKGGQKPAGDDVTTPAVLAAGTYGCQFTDPAATGTPTRSGAFFTTPCTTTH